MSSRSNAKRLSPLKQGLARLIMAWHGLYLTEGEIDSHYPLVFCRQNPRYTPTQNVVVLAELTDPNRQTRARYASVFIRPLQRRPNTFRELARNPVRLNRLCRWASSLIEQADEDRASLTTAAVPHLA